MPCPPSVQLPPASEGAVEIVRTLRASGHAALLAGGCVRDLLLGLEPTDFDVATDAPPERVCELFRSTRRVGAQFGVVLVRRRGHWIEVATFRADGPYLDGRRPTHVTFGDARQDALRRDFTINGMFFDPLSGELLDFVGGVADLQRRALRAIGEPAARFREDHLRLLRAVRFAARLAFDIEPATRAAIVAGAAALATVAAERVRDELERMLGHATRARAWRLLVESGLVRFLWPRAAWTDPQLAAAEELLASFPADSPFELALAAALADRPADELEGIGRALTLSNEQREAVLWLVAQHAALDEPSAISLAGLKRLLAAPEFPALHAWTRARYAALPDGAARREALARRIASISPEQIAPAPLVTGDDLAARGVAPGPIYRELLGELYTRQLDDRLPTRNSALAALDELLRSRGA